MVALWTHCRRQASDREEKHNSPGTRGGRGQKKTKNSTIEASMLLKKNDGILKRIQNELRIDCTMRALNAEFELLDATRVPARVWDAGMRPGSRLPGWRRSGGARENTKTVGTKLRSTCKQRTSLFWMLQIARVLHANQPQSMPEMSKNGTICVGQMARSRLLRTATDEPTAPLGEGFIVLVLCGRYRQRGVGAPMPRSRIAETKRECL